MGPNRYPTSTYAYSAISVKIQQDPRRNQKPPKTETATRSTTRVPKSLDPTGLSFLKITTKPKRRALTPLSLSLSLYIIYIQNSYPSLSLKNSLSLSLSISKKRNGWVWASGEGKGQGAQDLLQERCEDCGRFMQERLE